MCWWICCLQAVKLGQKRWAHGSLEIDRALRFAPITHWLTACWSTAYANSESYLSFSTYSLYCHHKAAIGEEDGEDRHTEVAGKHVHDKGFVVKAWGQSVIVRSAGNLNALWNIPVNVKTWNIKYFSNAAPEILVSLKTEVSKFSKALETFSWGIKCLNSVQFCFISLAQVHNNSCLNGLRTSNCKVNIKS